MYMLIGPVESKNVLYKCSIGYKLKYTENEFKKHYFPKYHIGYVHFPVQQGKGNTTCAYIKEIGYAFYPCMYERNQSIHAPLHYNKIPGTVCKKRASHLKQLRYAPFTA